MLQIQGLGLFCHNIQVLKPSYRHAPFSLASLSSLSLSEQNYDVGDRELLAMKPGRLTRPSSRLCKMSLIGGLAPRVAGMSPRQLGLRF